MVLHGGPVLSGRGTRERVLGANAWGSAPTWSGERLPVGSLVISHFGERDDVLDAAVGQLVRIGR